MKRFSLIALALACAMAVQAKVELPAVLGSNMVLQRNTKVNLWGKTAAGKKVKISASWTKEKVTAVADSDGKFKAQIATTEAGGPYTLTFDDGEKTVLENILLGEVWICSGQSNMEMPVAGFMNQPVENAAQHIAEALEYPGIRTFTVPRAVSNTPLDSCNSSWKTASPEAVRNFSAVGYFFGKVLHKALGVPVGMVTANWGGTVIEAWMSKECLDGVTDRKTEYDQNRNGANVNSVLYNAMLHPLIPFTAKGFIWYQGCSNRYNYFDYDKLQKAMIAQWRSEWGNKDMPFYFTQIAPYCYDGSPYRRSAVFVDEQWKTANETPHCDIICTTDIGEWGCIHPAAKFEVGQRLANLALTNDYGIKGIPTSFPRYKSSTVQGNKMVLSFHIEDSFNPHGPIKGFEIAGADGKFYPAKANMPWNKNTIEVWADEVAEPAAVRYAYCNCPEANVKSVMGLPLVPFRTDNWEITDLDKQ